MTNRQVALLAAALLHSGDPALGHGPTEVTRDAEKLMEWFALDKGNGDEET